MDLITTGISASERLRREQVLSATRNVIMDKMQLGGAAVRMLEVKDNGLGSRNMVYLITEFDVHYLIPALIYLAAA